jgi:hypothetical protein
MKNEENSLIATTIAIIIINTIVYLYNKTYLDICSISSLMFYGSIIIGIISIILIRKNLDKYKNVILLFNILFIFTGRVVAIFNIIIIIKLIRKNNKIYP